MLQEGERRQLDRVVELLQEVLEEAVLGAYLFGSATLDGLRHASDLDVLVLSSRPLAAAERRRLGDGMLALTGRPRRLELTVVARPEVRPWRFPPRMELQYGDWLRAAFERGDVEPERAENPDLAILLAMTLRDGVPLLGPPAAELLDPVPPGDLARALDACVDDVLADLDGDTRDVLLTLARVWCTNETGEILSKDAAAAWAVERLPLEHRPVLERASAIYLGEYEDRWDDLRPQLQRHVDHVVAAIRAAKRLSC